jgi:hypothetical protein
MGGDLALLSATPVRILRSRNSKASAKYVEAVATYMEEHRVLRRLVELSTAKHHDEAKIKAINQDISCAMSHTINTTQNIYLLPFSPQIKQARLRRRFYKLHLSMILNQLDLQRKLRRITQVLDKALPALSTLEVCLLQDAQNNVRNITKKAKQIWIT